MVVKVETFISMAQLYSLFFWTDTYSSNMLEVLNTSIPRVTTLVAESEYSIP